MHVLGLSGSLRRDSHNTALLHAASQLLPGGAALTVWPDLVEVPPYSEDADAAPAPPVVALRTAIAAADALLIATPQYTASIPRRLKNALDWASRPFPDNSLRDKPAAVIGASTSPLGPLWAQAEVRTVLRASGARVIDDDLAVGSAEQVFLEPGGLRDARLADGLERVLDGLLLEARAAVQHER